jgi:uncharacterized OB-fold protein
MQRVQRRRLLSTAALHQLWVTGLSWHASAGLGTVYTYTVIRQNRSSYFRDIIPYVIALLTWTKGSES